MSFKPLPIAASGHDYENFTRQSKFNGTLEYQRRRVWQRMVAELMKEADRRGMLNLTNCYHDASVVKSKKGKKKKLATRENTGLTG